MLFALPLFVAAGLVGRARQAGADARATGAWSRRSASAATTWRAFSTSPGLQYVSASLERLILYLNPTLVLLLGRVLFKRRVARAAAAGAGRQLRRRAAGLRPGAEARGRATPRSAPALVFASTLSYALYLVYSGEEVKRLGALRLTGLATSVACVLCIAQFLLLRPLAARCRWRPPVLWLSLLNATLCTFAPVLMVMMAIERIGAGDGLADWHDRPVVRPSRWACVILGEPFTAWIAAARCWCWPASGC